MPLVQSFEYCLRGLPTGGARRGEVQPRAFHTHAERYSDRANVCETARTVRVEVEGGGEVALPPGETLAVADAIRRAGRDAAGRRRCVRDDLSTR